MVAAACQQGMSALALIDRDGFYGAMEFVEAAANSGLPTVFGAELTLAPRQILTVLARGVEGYTSLFHLIIQARMRGSEDVTIYPPLADIVEGMGKNCRFLLNYSWCTDETQLEIFDPNTVVLEYCVTMRPEGVDRASARVAGAKQALASGNHCNKLHLVCTQWEAHGCEAVTSWREASISSCLTLLLRWPVTVLLCSTWWRRTCRGGLSQMRWLTLLGWVMRVSTHAIGGRSADVKNRARAQIDHELAVIKELGFPGYFLIVDDIVGFCYINNILCQGRGSAANSVVCFVFGITNIEPISTGLLFERFLSRDREGPQILTSSRGVATPPAPSATSAPAPTPVH